MWRGVDDGDGAALSVLRILDIGVLWNESLIVGVAIVLLVLLALFLRFPVQGTLVFLRFADAALVVGWLISRLLLLGASPNKISSRTTSIRLDCESGGTMIVHESIFFIGGTYCVRSVLGSVEVHHAIYAGKGRAVAAVPVRVELLLGEDIAAVLQRTTLSVHERYCSQYRHLRTKPVAGREAASGLGCAVGQGYSTSQEKETMVGCA